MSNYEVTLSLADISRIIQLSQNAGRSGQFVQDLFITTPKSATQSEIGLLVSLVSPTSASESDPIPRISVI